MRQWVMMIIFGCGLESLVMLLIQLKHEIEASFVQRIMVG